MAQTQPTAASRLFFIRRWVMEVTLPEALVTGADPAYAFSARSSANRSRSSPISARMRAPLTSARPGKLVMIGVVGVLAELLGRGLFELVSAGAGGVEHRQQGHRLAAHCFFHQVRLPQLRDPQALQDVGGQLVDAAFRPPRRSAASIRALVSRAACAGVGAIASIARASGLARLVADLPAKVARNAG